MFFWNQQAKSQSSWDSVVLFFVRLVYNKGHLAGKCSRFYLFMVLSFLTKGFPTYFIGIVTCCWNSIFHCHGKVITWLVELHYDALVCTHTQDYNRSSNELRNEVWPSEDLCNFDCYGRHGQGYARTGEGSQRIRNMQLLWMKCRKLGYISSARFWAQPLNAVSTTTSASPQNLSRVLLL